MEDDVTVGIQLLLEDGVSDALTAMMMQLDATDRAIAATAANWEGLPVGDGIPLSPGPISQGPSADTSTSAAAPDFGFLDFSTPSPVPEGNIIAEATTAAPSQLPAQDATSSRADSLPLSYAPALPASDEANPTWPTIAVTSDIPDYEKPSQVSANSSAPIDSDFGLPVSLPASPGKFDAESMVHSVAPIAPDTPPVAPPALAGPDDRSWEFQSLLSSAPTVPAQAGSAAPRAPDMAAPMTAGSDAVPSGGSVSDAMATAPADEAGGGEGQLMVDGSLLGRWIIDHLAREADRPPAGGTAFDPRQGHAWSGIG